MTHTCCGANNDLILHTLFSGLFELTPEEEALKPQYQAEWDALQRAAAELNDEVISAPTGPAE